MEFEADGLSEAMAHVTAERAKDWDVYSFRAPPRKPEPPQEFKYL